MRIKTKYLMILFILILSCNTCECAVFAYDYGTYKIMGNEGGTSYISWRNTTHDAYVTFYGLTWHEQMCFYDTGGQPMYYQHNLLFDYRTPYISKRTSWAKAPVGCSSGYGHTNIGNVTYSTIANFTIGDQGYLRDPAWAGAGAANPIGLRVSQIAATYSPSPPWIISGDISNVTWVGLYIHESGNYWMISNQTFYNINNSYSFDIYENITYTINMSDGNSYTFLCDGNIIYPIIPIIPSYTNEYTFIFNDLFSDLSVWSFITVVFGTYETFCGGNLFWLIIIVIPFMMTWIKQGSVIIPSMLALLCGSSLFVLLPVEAVTPIKYLLIIGIAGIFYHIIKSR